MSVGPQPTAMPSVSHASRSALHSKQERSLKGSTTCTPRARAHSRSSANAPTVSPAWWNRAWQWRDHAASGQRCGLATKTVTPARPRDRTQASAWVVCPSSTRTRSGDGIGRLHDLRGRVALRHDRAVDGEHLLRQRPFVQVLHRLAAGAPLAAAQHTLERRRDGFGPVIGAELTAFDAPQTQGDVADRNRYHREIAGERLLHDVGRTLLHRREDEGIARVHEVRNLGVGCAPGEYQLGGDRAIEDVYRGSRQAVSLTWQGGLSGEQDHARLGRSTEVTPRFVLGDEAEQTQVQARGDHMHADGWRDEVPHVRRHDDARVGLASDGLGRELQQPAAQREVPVGIFDALDIIAPERHDERQPFGKREHAALTELGMHEIVAPAREAAPRADPGLDVIPRIAAAFEVEYVHVHSRRLQELRLTLDEERRARTAVGDGPFAGDHQHPDGGACGHQRFPVAPKRSSTAWRRAARAAPGSSFRSRKPARTQGNTWRYAAQRFRRYSTEYSPFRAYASSGLVSSNTGSVGVGVISFNRRIHPHRRPLETSTRMS